MTAVDRPTGDGEPHTQLRTPKEQLPQQDDQHSYNQQGDCDVTNLTVDCNLGYDGVMGPQPSDKSESGEEMDSDIHRPHKGTEDDDDWNVNYAEKDECLSGSEGDNTAMITCCCMMPPSADLPMGVMGGSTYYAMGEQDQILSLQQETTLTTMGFVNSTTHKQTQHARQGTQQMAKLCDEMAANLESEKEAGHDTRSWVYANLNGGVRRIQGWKNDGHAQLERMKRLNVSAFFITETHGSYQHRRREGEAIQEVMAKHVGGSWTAYLCNHKEKKQAGVGIVVRKDWNHKIWWGLNSDGRPLEYRDDNNKQGRYLILESTDMYDVDDYIVYYAPNSGIDQRTIQEQARLAERIAAAADYWKRSKPDRQLHIVGDFNFSSRHDQHMVNGSEMDPTLMLNAKGCTQGMASARDSEWRINSKLFEGTGMVDMESRWAHVTGTKERTTVRLDFKHLASLKKLQKTDWAGGHKVNARVDKVYTCTRMRHDDATCGGHDATKLGMRFVNLEYLQFDPGHGNDVTAGTDHAIIYGTQRRKQWNSHEGMGWILSKCAQHVMQDVACNVAGAQEGIEEDLTLIMARNSITMLQATLRAMDDTCDRRRQSAGITTLVTRPYEKWGWTAALEHIAKVRSKMRGATVRMDEWTKQGMLSPSTAELTSEAVQAYGIITGRALVAITNETMGGLTNTNRGRSRVGVTGDDIRSKLKENVQMMQIHTYTKEGDDKDGLIAVWRQKADDDESIKVQQQQLALREDPVRRKHDLECRHKVAQWMLRH